MNLSLALVLVVLSQRVPNPGTPPQPYFTELLDYSGLAITQGHTDGDSLITARLSLPTLVATDAAGWTFVLTDGAAPGTSSIRLVVGTNTTTWATMPFGVREFGGMVVDPTTHELYLTNTQRHLIIKISAQGNHSVLAGNSTPVSCTIGLQNCFAGGFRDGFGTSAQFNSPWGIALDGGRLYIADTFNHAIRRMTLSGDVETIITSTTDFAPRTLLVDSARSRFIYVAELSLFEMTFAGAITRLAGATVNVSSELVDGEASAARFVNPQGLAIDAAGNIFVADSYFTWVDRRTHGAIRQFTPGQTFPRTPWLSYPATVGTLRLRAACYQLGQQVNVCSDTELTVPTGLAWLGTSLVVTDNQRHNVRLIR